MLVILGLYLLHSRSAERYGGEVRHLEEARVVTLARSAVKLKFGYIHLRAAGAHHAHIAESARHLHIYIVPLSESAPRPEP